MSCQVLIVAPSSSMISVTPAPAAGTFKTILFVSMSTKISSRSTDSPTSLVAMLYLKRIQGDSNFYFSSHVILSIFCKLIYDMPNGNHRLQRRVLSRLFAIFIKTIVGFLWHNTCSAMTTLTSGTVPPARRFFNSLHSMIVGS